MYRLCSPFSLIFLQSALLSTPHSKKDKLHRDISLEVSGQLPKPLLMDCPTLHFLLQAHRVEPIFYGTKCEASQCRQYDSEKHGESTGNGGNETEYSMLSGRTANEAKA